MENEWLACAGWSLNPSPKPVAPQDIARFEAADSSRPGGRTVRYPSIQKEDVWTMDEVN
jgi:hypothetical protein